MIRLFVFIFLLSCSGDEAPNYSKEEFLKMARSGDPNLKIRTPKSISHALVNCVEYTPACRFGYRVIVKNVEMVALYYEKQSSALKAAKRRRQYVARNWVLDEVRGEPVLERYVEKYLKAKKAF